jgi:hypothetical protein
MANQTRPTERRPLGQADDKEFTDLLFQWLGNSHQAPVREAGRRTFYAPETLPRTQQAMTRLQAGLQRQLRRRDVPPPAQAMARRVLEIIPRELAEIRRLREGVKPGGGGDARDQARHLAGLPDREFRDAVRSWMASGFEAHRQRAHAFRDPLVADRTLRMVTALTDLDDTDSRIVVPSRVEREIAVLVEIMLWGKRLPKMTPPKITVPGQQAKPAAAPAPVRPGPPRPAPPRTTAPARPARAATDGLTQQDREEIEYFAAADDAEFIDGVNEWLTLGDDDGSGERVFLSPRLIKRTHHTVGALIHSATLSISRARQDPDATGKLRELMEELTKVRAETRASVGVRRKTREPVAVAEPTTTDRLEIQYLAEVDDAEFAGVVSDWVSRPGADGSGERVLLSRDLVERTHQTLYRLFLQAGERLTTAKRRGNPDRVRDVSQHRRALFLARQRAAEVARGYRRSRQDGPPSPRQHAYAILQEVLGPEYKQIKARLRKRKPAVRELARRHPRLFTRIRREIAEGMAPEQARELARELSG